jgi:hypothetical protein
VGRIRVSKLKTSGGVTVDRERMLRQLEVVLAEYQNADRNAAAIELSGRRRIEARRLLTLALGVIHRVGGLRSVYASEAERILADNKSGPDWHASQIRGILESLRFDVANGYWETATELAHAEVFADFLDMARYLNTEGYKDAAAVIVGSSLEAHLRQLCGKWGVGVEVQSAKGLTPKKADLMNADLAKTDAYGKLDQKSITAWLDLRNDAAHGHYDKYTAEQVALLISGVRDFMTRCPA